MPERTTLVGVRERQAPAMACAQVEIDDLGGRLLHSIAVRLAEFGGSSDESSDPMSSGGHGCGPAASSGASAPYWVRGLVSVSLGRGIDAGAVGTR